MEEISPKELLISVIVVLLALTIGVAINPVITDRMFDDIRTYQQALQIDGDIAQFQYAQQTNVGNVFAYGEMSANYPVSLPELTGSYGYLQRVTERYNMHSRQVCATHDKNGNCTSYRTEIYYSWDTHNREFFVSESFTFLGVIFLATQLHLDTPIRENLSVAAQPSLQEKVEGNYLYEDDTWASVGDLRYYYDFLPVRFPTSVFVRFMDGSTINPIHHEKQIDVYFNQTREATIDSMKNHIKVFNIFYYGILVALLGGGYYYWAYYEGDI